MKNNLIYDLQSHNNDLVCDNFNFLYHNNLVCDNFDLCPF